VVALAQHGIEFAVATLGTATTPVHARTLLRHTDRLIYAFDGDNAGRKAAWRALENTLEALQDGKTVSFLFLPEGEDPDSYIRANGQAAFLHLLDHDTLPLSAFLIRELARDRRLDTQEDQAALLKDAKPLLEKIAAPMLGGLIQRQLAERLGMAPDELGRFGKSFQPGRAARVPPRSARRPAPSRLRGLARSLLMNPQRAVELEGRWIDENDPLSQALRELLAWLADVGPASLPTLTEAARGSALAALIEELAAELLDKDADWDWNAEFDGAVRQLRDDWRKRRAGELAARPLASLNADERAELAELARS